MNRKNPAACMPHLWDGHPVSWTPWEPGPIMCRAIDEYSEDGVPLASHAPCEFCHMPAGVWACTGIVERDSAVTATRRGDLTVLSMTPATRVLAAFRCDRCGATTVHDMWDDKVWELDESDYGPGGSWESNE